jgi:extracellular elastinolytic metalloproteinase
LATEQIILALRIIGIFIRLQQAQIFQINTREDLLYLLFQLVELGLTMKKNTPENFHAMYDVGFRSARGILSKTSPEAIGIGRLSAQVPDIVVSYDEATQLPNSVVSRQPTTRLSVLSATSPEEAATQFIQNWGDLWNLTSNDLETVEVTSVSRKGLNTVNLIQRVEGKEVFGSEITVAVSASKEVISLSGQIFPGTGVARSLARAATTTSIPEAISKAAFDLTGIVYTAADFIVDGNPADNYQFYKFVPQPNDSRPAFERSVRVKDVMFPLGDGQFVPSYYMELWVKGFSTFSYVMDAIDTPDLLFRKNLTSSISFKYHVHNTGDQIFRPEDGPAPGTPHPTGTPDGFQASIVPEKLIDIESLLPGDPWLPPSATTTKGNNCIAYADLKSPQGKSPGDVFGKTTASGVFNYTYNHSKPASDPQNLQSSLVGMFFHVNWLHDRWYEAGFDEASGNAQQNNYGRGGIGKDPILAEGNDFSGTDNANMTTPADGVSPRMQMYEFKGVNPLPSRTSNFEALITFHEMGHYITNRLVGNANGLSNIQGRAMGEGWGDFFAICMTSQSTDNFVGGVFAAGGWTDLQSTFRENYYFSIRRYPYSVDISKNPLTFKHISDGVLLPVSSLHSSIVGGPNNEVHNAGEVWCTILWEVFVNLVVKYQHEEAERRMLIYIVGGLKLTPSNPTFTQARDGIIATISALHSEDLPQVWAGFAKRGMGVNAVSPPASSSTLAGVVESFNTP